MLKYLLPAVALIAAVSTVSISPQAAPWAMGAAGPHVTPANDVELAGTRAGKRVQRHASRAGSLKGGGVARDTCPANDATCIKDLTASCDKAGGGLSTWPDGSVDCYVVGIHDQP